MAKKAANKRKKLQNREKEATPAKNPWPDLPYQLLAWIPKPRYLKPNVTSFDFAIKSWRSSPSKRCSPISNPQFPQLVEIHPKERKNTSHHSNSIIEKIPFRDVYFYWYHKQRSSSSWYPYKGHSHGQEIVVLGTSYRQRKVETNWVLENFCSLKDPYSTNHSQIMQFSNAIRFQGKFYALSLQGSLVVIEEIDSNSFRITGVGGNRAVPSRRSRQFREYLLGCDGEILLVFLISRKGLDFVDDVEVYRLDMNEILWMKVENLEGRTLFLEDECCMWMSGGKVGCRSNCIYFTHHGVDDWFFYEMGNCQIFPVSGDCMRWDEIMEQD